MVFTLKSNVVDKLPTEADVKDYWGVNQLSKDEVGYTPVGMDGDKACASCRWFMSPDGCTLVYGDISPTGLSDLYRAIEPYKMDPIEVRVVKASDKSVSLLDKVRNWLVPQAAPDQRGAVRGAAFTLKEVGPDLRFYLRVSNNFEDREHQTITLAAHKEYIEWVEAENAYPELWVWHASKSRLGQVDLLDVSNGVLVASGLIDADRKEVAVALAESGECDGVSHGFLHKSIGNDIVRYRSYEISLVPRRFAANYAGGGVLLTKELEMAFTPEKKALLTKYYGEEQVNVMEKDTERLQAEFASMGVQSKEVDESVTLAEQLAALTKAMADGFTVLAAGNKAALTSMEEFKAEMATARTEVAEAKKTLDERVEETLSPKVAPSSVVAPSQSDKNIVDAKGEKELASVASNDWFGEQIAGIVGRL